MPRHLHDRNPPPPPGFALVPRRSTSSVDAAARALAGAVLEQLRAELAASPAPGWPWLPWRLWARSSTHARRLAARERIRTTSLGRDLYGHREDLEQLAARNAAPIGSPANDDQVDDEVAALFAGGGGR